MAPRVRVGSTKLMAATSFGIAMILGPMLFRVSGQGYGPCSPPPPYATACLDCANLANVVGCFSPIPNGFHLGSCGNMSGNCNTPAGGYYCGGTTYLCAPPGVPVMPQPNPNPCNAFPQVCGP